MSPVASVLGTIDSLFGDVSAATPTTKRQLLPDLTGLLNGLGGLTSAIPGVVSGITGAVPIVPQVLGGIASAVPSLVGGVASAIPSVVGGLTSAIPDILGGVTSILPGAGLNALGDLDNVASVIYMVVNLLTSILDIVNQFANISGNLSFPAHEPRRVLANTNMKPIDLTHSLAAGPEALIVGLLSAILSSVGGLVPLAGLAGTLTNGSVPTSLVNNALGAVGL